MPEGYDLLAGILVALVVVVMLGSSFGSSHP